MTMAKSAVLEEACDSAVLEGVVSAGVDTVNLVKADFGGVERGYCCNIFIFSRWFFSRMPSKHDFTG
jgi:hypothetical protein